MYCFDKVVIKDLNSFVYQHTCSSLCINKLKKGYDEYDFCLFFFDVMRLVPFYKNVYILFQKYNVKRDELCLVFTDLHVIFN